MLFASSSLSKFNNIQSGSYMKNSLLTVCFNSDYTIEASKYNLQRRVLAGVKMIIIRKSNLLQALYCMILIGYPFCAVASTLLPSLGNYPAYFLRAFILLMSSILIGAGLLNGKIRPASLWLVFFIIMYSLRLGYDIGVYGSQILSEVVLFFVIVVIIPVMAAILTDHMSLDQKLLTKLIAMFSTLLIVTLFLMWLSGYAYNPWEGVSENPRFGLESLNPISVGYYSSICIISCSLLVMDKKISSLLKFIAIIGIFLGLVMLLLANSRGPIAALIIVLLFISRKQITNSITIWFVYLFGLSLIVFFTDLFTPILDRSLPTFTGDFDLSVLGRLDYQLAAIEIFLENLLIGGAALIPEGNLGTHPHNLPIEIAMSLGLLGLSVFCFCYFIALRRITDVYYDSNPLLPALFIGAAVMTMFSGSIATSGAFFFILAGVLSSTKVA